MHTSFLPFSVFGSQRAGGPLDPLRQLNGYEFANAERLPRAPDNVFIFRGKEQEVLGWRNVFELPIQYDVELCPGLLSEDSPTLSFRFLPDGGPRRRFVVIGEKRGTPLDAIRFQVTNSSIIVQAFPYSVCLFTLLSPVVKQMVQKTHRKGVSTSTVTFRSRPLSDDAVQRLYGAKIAANFAKNDVTVHTVVLPGEEVSLHCS